MLTAIVAASDDAIPLAETLAALVPAAIEGLARRVLVVTPGPSERVVAQLIEASGAAHVASDGDALALWRAGLSAAAPGWRLCLIAGAVPTGAWIEAVARHVSLSDGPAAFAVPGAGPKVAAAAARFWGRPYPLAGLLTRDIDLAARGRILRLSARIDDRRHPSAR